MTPPDIDINLVQLAPSTFEAWMDVLHQHLPWLQTNPANTPSHALLKAIGTQARILPEKCLELSIDDASGNRPSMVVSRDKWSWR